MPFPKIEDARKLNDEELASEIISVKRELFDLRFQKATGNLEKTHQFKHNRHRLAQLMTVERERQLAELKGVTKPETSEAESESTEQAESEASQTESQPEQE